MAHYKRTIPIKNCILSLADIRKIYQRLQACVTEEGTRELAALDKPVAMTEQEFRDFKEQARTFAYKVSIHITGKDGSTLVEPSDAVFDSDNLPDQIESIFMANQFSYEFVAKRKPVNMFSCLLDFSKPPLVDNNNFVSNPTPNNSTLTIEGDRDTWLSAVADQVMGIVDKRRTKRRWLHIAFAYDVGLVLIGAPAAFYVCWKASELVHTHIGSQHSVLAGAAYIYLFFTTVMLFRVLFGYTKWGFPVVELESDTNISARHRKWWYGILVALSVPFLRDFLKAWWAMG